jgi:uncharacterized membrane protein YdjX (TVP38/TMEM64 family)
MYIGTIAGPLTVTGTLTLNLSMGQTSIKNIMTLVLAWIDSLGNWGVLLFIAFYVLATMLLISAAVLTLGAGLLFGVVKGSIIASIASTIGATVSFLLGRYLLRDWVAKEIEKRPKFQAIDRAVAKNGWKIVGLTRLSPLFPFVFLDYAFGVTKVPLKDYVLATWIAMIPSTVMYVYLGYIPRAADSTMEAATHGDLVHLVLKVMTVIATIAITVYITRLAHQSLNEELQLNYQRNDSDRV